MKRIFISLILTVLMSGYLMAQDNTLNDFLLDFSVPDMPAFKALGTDPSEILRPSDIQKFGVMVSAFRSGGETIIPKSFAVEVAPWKLGSSKWTVGMYQENGLKRLLYNSSISIGSVSGPQDNEARNVSLGFRTSFISKNGDILRSPVIDSLYNRQRSVLTERNKVKEEWANADSLDFATLTPEQDQEFNLYYDSLVQVLGPNYTTRVAELVETFNAHNWNSTRFDFAFAWVGASPDSLIKNTHSENFMIWATAAIKPGKNNDHGQLLLGINFQRPRTELGESEANTRFVGNIRYYEGTRNFRGFLEFQYTSEKRNDIQRGLLNLGAELRVMNDFWVAFSAGVDDVFEEDAGSVLVSSVDVRYSFNKPK